MRVQIQRYFFILCLFILGIGCSKKDHHDADGLLVKPQACVSGFFSIQYNYFFNPDMAPQVSENVNCVESAMSRSAQHLANQKNGLSAEGFRVWLNDNFFIDEPLSSQHMASWMMLKTWLVGGNNEKVTHQELNHLLNIIQHWKVLVKKIEPDLKVLVSTNDSALLKKSYDSILQKLDQFLFYFPNLISDFHYQSFVALLYQNKTYHNNYLEEIKPSLIRSILWFSNGQEKVIVSKRTTHTLMLFFYQFHKYKAEVGNNFISILLNIDAFVEYSQNLLSELDKWFQDIQVFDYKGFEYFASYLAQYVFEGKYSTEQVFKVMKLINEDYLSTNSNEYINGFSIEQKKSLEKIVQNLSNFNKRVDSSEFDPMNEGWLGYFVETNRARSENIGLSEIGQLDFFAVQTPREWLDSLKLINLIITPIDLSIKVRGKYFRSGLTEAEFNALKSDFIVFEALWSSTGSAVTFEDAASLSRFTYDRIRVDHEKLFYFFTQSIQSENFKSRISLESMP